MLYKENEPPKRMAHTGTWFLPEWSGYWSEYVQQRNLLFNLFENSLLRSGLLEDVKNKAFEAFENKEFTFRKWLFQKARVTQLLTFSNAHYLSKAAVSTSLINSER